jgi:putative Mn2+ efflux pump MntP
MFATVQVLIGTLKGCTLIKATPVRRYYKGCAWNVFTFIMAVCGMVSHSLSPLTFSEIFSYLVLMHRKVQYYVHVRDHLMI